MTPGVGKGRIVRRAAVIAAALAACRAPAAEPDFHAGAALSAVPGVGASVSAGQYLRTRDARPLVSMEIEAVAQGVDDGRFVQALFGLRHVFGRERARWVLRYGVTWLRATGDPLLFTQPGDYVGGYVGAQRMYEIAPRLRTGPELRLVVVNGEGSAGMEVLGQVGWALAFDF
jgi:hypothetical protein